MRIIKLMAVTAGVLSMLAGVSLLTGCKEDKPVQTTEWYKEHNAERQAMLEECKANPGELAATPNCVNASRADSSKTWSARGAGIKPVAPLTAEELKKK